MSQKKTRIDAGCVVRCNIGYGAAHYKGDTGALGTCSECSSRQSELLIATARSMYRLLMVSSIGRLREIAKRSGTVPLDTSIGFCLVRMRADLVNHLIVCWRPEDNSMTLLARCTVSNGERIPR